MTSFVPVETDEQVQIVADLAQRIWTEHYTPIIGSDQVKYMVENFQSVPAILQQVKDGLAYYIQFQNEVPVGYLCFYPKDQSLFLSKIYVEKSFRGKGYGKQAMDFVAKSALERGLNAITLTVNKYNKTSIDAYQKMGFEIEKPIVMDIGGGFVMDDYAMRKPLTPKV